MNARNIRHPGERLADSLLLAAIHRQMGILRGCLSRIPDARDRATAEAAIECLGEDCDLIRERLDNDDPHVCPR